MFVYGGYETNSPMYKSLVKSWLFKFKLNSLRVTLEFTLFYKEIFIKLKRTFFVINFFCGKIGN